MVDAKRKLLKKKTSVEKKIVVEKKDQLESKELLSFFFGGVIQILMIMCVCFHAL